MRKYYLCNKGWPEFCSGLVWMFLSGMFCRFMKMMTDYQTNEREKTVLEGNAKIT